jgi:hypothetical protein
MCAAASVAGIDIEDVGSGANVEWENNDDERLSKLGRCDSVDAKGDFDALEDGAVSDASAAARSVAAAKQRSS